MSDLDEQIRTYFEATTEPSAVELPNAARSSEQVHDATTVRSSSMKTLNESVQVADRAAPRWRRPYLVAAAIVGVVALVLSAFFFGSGGSDVIAPVDPDPVASTPSPVGASTPEAAAIEVVDRMFAAFERGDVAAMKEAFAPDIEITGYLGTDFDAVMEWSIAQHFQLGDRSCVATRAASDIETYVVCEYPASDYLMRTLGAGSALNLATFTVSDNKGIVFYNERQLSSDVLLIGEYFEEWLAAEHPSDAARANCCEWESTAEAIAGGAAWVTYAEEYAAYLGENKCAYDAPCRP